MEATIRENDALRKEIGELRRINQEINEENEKLTAKLNATKMQVDELVRHIESVRKEIMYLRMVIRAFEAGSGKTIIEEWTEHDNSRSDIQSVGGPGCRYYD